MAISKPRHRVWRIAIGETSETGIRCQRTDDRRQKRVELVEKWNRIADLTTSTVSTI